MLLLCINLVILCLGFRLWVYWCRDLWSRNRLFYACHVFLAPLDHLQCWWNWWHWSNYLTKCIDLISWLSIALICMLVLLLLIAGRIGISALCSFSWALRVGERA